MRAIALLALLVAAISAAQGEYTFDPRIIGGSVTTIAEYPNMAALLYSSNLVTFSQSCGATILNNRSLLSAAHCFHDARNNIQRWRFRVGSALRHSGGTVYNSGQHIIHPNYHRPTIDSDIMIMRSQSNIVFILNAVQPVSIAGTNYNLGDGEVVWATGWGVTETGSSSEQLRHVQVWTVSQAICRQRYGQAAITDNMLCSGWLDVGGRDQCQGDSGGPLYHNGTVQVGICSWGRGCAQARYPGVNVRVSRFTTWIVNNA